MCLHTITSRHEYGSDFYNRVIKAYGMFEYSEDKKTLVTPHYSLKVKLDEWLVAKTSTTTTVTLFTDGVRDLSYKERAYHVGFHKLASKKAVREMFEMDSDCNPGHYRVMVILPVFLWGTRIVGTETVNYNDRDVKCYVADQMYVEQAPLDKLLKRVRKGT